MTLAATCGNARDADDERTFARGHGSPPSAPTAVRDAGIAATQAIARRLAALLTPPAGWSRGELVFEEPGTGYEQYGSIRVFSCDTLDFCVWLDRTTYVGEPDKPIICAAFGADDPATARALKHLAIGWDVQPQSYEYNQESRFVGFGEKPVLDEPANDARFLSCYRPAGAFDVEAGVASFRSFFEEWSPRLRDLPAIPKTGRAPADGLMRVLRGLVGELTVLAMPEMEGAEWVGPSNFPYDVKRGRTYIEVKTRAQEAATLSPSQILASVDERYLFALVDLPASTQALLWADDAAQPGLGHPIVAKHRKEVEAFLPRFAIDPTAGRLAVIEQAVKGAAGCVGFFKAQPPSGFFDAVTGVERFGRVSSLSVECGPDWFVPTALPPPDRGDIPNC